MTMNFIVSAGHYEYGFAGEGVTVTDVWAPDFDVDYDDYDAEWERQTGLPADEMPDADLGFEHIIRIEGEPTAIRNALAVLIADLRENPGGDDGTFDYWPSGVRMALDIDAALVAQDTSSPAFSISQASAIADAVAHVVNWGRQDFADELYDKIGLERPATLTPSPRVWVVVTLREGAITDLEILSAAPEWDLAEHGQVCFEGNINGGDSLPYPLPPNFPLLNRIRS